MQAPWCNAVNARLWGSNADAILERRDISEYGSLKSDKFHFMEQYLKEVDEIVESSKYFR